MSAAPPRRLDPCPCGSGRRYKDCHGSFADPLGAQIDAALVSRSRGDARGARERLEAIVEAHPREARALDGLGLLHYDALELDRAEAMFRAAIAIAPESPRPHMHLGMTLLLQDRYAEGWREYEWRSRVPGPANFANHPFGMPRWRGEPLAGKRILVHAEQGLGDTIQFARFLTRLAREGAEVDLFCHSPLAPLLARVEGVHAALGALDERPTHDYHAPLGDVAAHYLPDTAAPHWSGTYLEARADRIESWRGSLASLDQPRVGIVARGNPLHVNDRNRSLPPEIVASLRIDRGTLVALQPDVRSVVPDAVDLGARILDWDDTAAILHHVDALVTVDTSVAHLAGAMGRPVHLLLPACPDWRWGLAGEATRWYPSLRLFRQRRPGEWTRAVTDALVAAACR